MVREAERALGAFISNHPTDNSRRGRVGLIGLLVGLGFTAVAVPATIEMFSEGVNASKFVGLLWGGALLGLTGGITNGLKSLKRHGEVFALREQGLVYKRTGETRILPWTEIRSVVDRGQDNPVSRSMGWDTHLVIRPRQGGKLVLSGFTENAAALSTAIRASVDTAANS
ncbi:hypothetical protein [Streptomyces sp. NPDC058045]|uniref:hypothetical protein n=1 Tax=Streptomyces sp. NPDC058045 TaxID=3346311 RepID=UPI0036E7379B